MNMAKSKTRPVEAGNFKIDTLVEKSRAVRNKSRRPMPRAKTGNRRNDSDCQGPKTIEEKKPAELSARSVQLRSGELKDRLCRLAPFHLPEHPQQPVHVQRLQEYVNLCWCNRLPPLAQLWIDRVAEDRNLIGSLRGRHPTERIEELAVVSIADIDNEQIGMFGVDELERLMSRVRPGYVMSKLSEQASRGRILRMSIRRGKNNRS
jgi:hypothetical protein